MDFIKYCNRNQILLAICPPHLTHTLQPLNVVMFKPLSSAYSAKVAAFIERSQGLTSITKRDFYPMFIAAWEASFKKATILKAFEATGPSPFNPEVILKRFHQPAQSGQSSDSDSSALNASNWREIERLLRQVVADRSDPQAQKLSRAFHRISVQKSLLIHEAQGLRQALINKRTRRKQGKALPLRADEEYHSRAIFYSPEKVKDARDRLHQQELEEEQQRLQKVGKARDRENQRQAKAHNIRVRRKARAEARIARQAVKARKAQQRLQQAQKNFPKGQET
jgi:hypothetical protein